MVREGESGESANPTYTKWLLDAIHKVKSQKQRPNDDRICHAVKQSHHNVSKDSLMEQLALAVKDGVILKVLNKGICSYRDPNSGPRLKPLKVNRKTDLTRFIVRALKNSSTKSGLTIKQIEKYVEACYSVESLETSLIENIKVSVRKGISKNVFEKDGKLIKLIPKANAGNGRSNSDDELSSDHSFCFEEEKVCNNVEECCFCLVFIFLTCSSVMITFIFISPYI